MERYECQSDVKWIFCKLIWYYRVTRNLFFFFKGALTKKRLKNAGLNLDLIQWTIISYKKKQTFVFLLEMASQYKKLVE